MQLTPFGPFDPSQVGSSGSFSVSSFSSLIAMLQVFQHLSKPDTDIITKNITLTEPEMKMMILKKNLNSQLVMDQMDQRVSTALLESKRCAQETKSQNSKMVKNKTASSGHFAPKTLVWLLVLTATKLVFQLSLKKQVDLLLHNILLEMKLMILNQLNHFQIALV
jgi:hypothetical protein